MSRPHGVGVVEAVGGRSGVADSGIGIEDPAVGGDDPAVLHERPEGAGGGVGEALGGAGRVGERGAGGRDEGRGEQGRERDQEQGALHQNTAVSVVPMPTMVPPAV